MLLKCNQPRFFTQNFNNNSKRQALHSEGPFSNASSNEQSLFKNRKQFDTPGTFKNNSGFSHTEEINDLKQSLAVANDKFDNLHNSVAEIMRMMQENNSPNASSGSNNKQHSSHNEQ